MAGRQRAVELRELTRAELSERLRIEQQALRSAVEAVAAGKEKNHAQLRARRRTVARIKTVMRHQPGLPERQP